MLLDLITSDVKMARSKISNIDFLITFQKGLRSLLPVTIMTGGERPDPSLSSIRFVPSRTQIWLSKEWAGGNSVTGGASALSGPPSAPVPLGGGLRLLSPFSAFSF